MCINPPNGFVESIYKGENTQTQHIEHKNETGLFNPQTIHNRNSVGGRL